jgi:hypothetical protein
MSDEIYCEQAVSETACSINQTYSMMLLTELLECLFQMPTGQNVMGSKQREREREREIERWINGLRDLEMA